MTYLCLIGEQPLPNLLPVLHLKPSRVVLFYSDRTKKVSTRLTTLIQESGIDCSSELVNDPHRIDLCALQFREQSAKYSDAIYNATGGTKPMAMAALAVAAEFRQDVHYVVTEGNAMNLHRYTFEQGNRAVMAYLGFEEIPEVLNIDYYLRSHVSGYYVKGFASNSKTRQAEDGIKYEIAVYEEIKRAGYEVLSGVFPKGFNRQIEIDLIVRCKNSVAIIETKKGWKNNSDSSSKKQDPAKRALEQVTLTWEEFSPFSTRLVVTAAPLPSELAEMGRKARIHSVHAGYKGLHLTAEGKQQLLGKLAQLIGTP